MKSPKIQAVTFALVDVKGGRKALAKLVGDHKHKIRINLVGDIVGVWSRDDGTSIEFEVAVTETRLGKPRKQHCTCSRCKTREASQGLG